MSVICLRRLPDGYVAWSVYLRYGEWEGQGGHGPTLAKALMDARRGKGRKRPLQWRIGIMQADGRSRSLCHGRFESWQKIADAAESVPFDSDDDAVRFTLC